MDRWQQGRWALEVAAGRLSLEVVAGWGLKSWMGVWHTLQGVLVSLGFRT